MDIEELIRKAEKMNLIKEDPAKEENQKIFDEYGNYRVDTRQKFNNTALSAYKYE